MAEEESSDSATLLDLPVELLYQVFTHLPLSSLYRLGSTCRRLHALVHRNDRYARILCPRAF